ncbi:hypothetical protein [Cellvibrio sp. NN19]|uniref:hypothetical protein n=1 Tax=Cellvibrio chitinivorans TaxID=3102792 RepID=UPI002B4169F8|nr:hypothetical protein [Cellvibrio sp. NN19]
MFSMKEKSYRRQALGRSLAVIAFVVGVNAVGALAQDNYVAAGSAYSLDDNQLVYRELYTGLDENKSVRVDYVTPEGTVFASKTLVYQGEPFQPSFNFEDTRDNEFASAQFQGARLVLTHGMNSSQNEKVIFDNAKTVIDTGFDAYIQLNWDKLLSGKKLKFDFAIPARLGSVALEVRKIKGSDSPVYDANYGKEWIYFRIAPAKKFSALFADPINLAYDPNGKYLMRFHGRSNIDDDRGGPQDVRIEYEYTN